MENQEEVPLSRSPVDFFVKPEQISGLFFNSYAINFPLCLRDRAGRNSCIKIRYKVCFFRHSGFCVRIRKPEKFQQQKDSCRFQGYFSYLFPSVSMSPRMVWTIQIADSVPSFQDFLGFVFTVSRFHGFLCNFSICILIISFFPHFLN